MAVAVTVVVVVSLSTDKLHLVNAAALGASLQGTLLGQLYFISVVSFSISTRTALISSGYSHRAR
jgi:hypothetical protein